MNLNRIYHVNINVSDLDRSLAFYAKLGFEVLSRFELSAEQCSATCRAFGAEPNALRGAFLRLGSATKAPLIDLVQWLTFPTKGTATPNREPHHAGLFRLAFHVDDPEAILTELRQSAIPLMGPVATGPTPDGGRFSLFAFRDPDGTVLEVISGLER